MNPKTWNWQSDKKQEDNTNEAHFKVKSDSIFIKISIKRAAAEGPKNESWTKSD